VIRRLRVGELLAVAGIACVVVALLEPWYESPAGQLDAFETFGPSIALLLAAACASLALVASALTERTTALPVAIAVWNVPLGLLALIASVVRVLERPDHASGLKAGPWLALVGSSAILVGAWLALRDERPGLYRPAEPEPRPRP
jgi:hypothetical protein